MKPSSIPYKQLITKETPVLEPGDMVLEIDRFGKYYNVLKIEEIEDDHYKFRVLHGNFYSEDLKNRFVYGSVEATHSSYKKRTVLCYKLLPLNPWRVLYGEK